MLKRGHRLDWAQRPAPATPPGNR